MCIALFRYEYGLRIQEWLVGKHIDFLGYLILCPMPDGPCIEIGLLFLYELCDSYCRPHIDKRIMRALYKFLSAYPFLNLENLKKQI